jgi:hypothetical protein
MGVLDSIRDADVLSIDTHGDYRLTLTTGVLTVGTAFLLAVNGRSQGAKALPSLAVDPRVLARTRGATQRLGRGRGCVARHGSRTES